MIWIIGSVQIASGCQTGDVRGGPDRVTGMGRGIGRQWPRKGHRVAEIGCHRGEVIHRLVRQVGRAGKITVDPIRPGIVGGQEAGSAVLVIHLADISGAGQNIVVRVIGVVAEPVAFAQPLICRGHDLHQTHRPDRRDGLLLSS